MAKADSELLLCLASAVAASAMYPPSHPLAREPLSALGEALAARLSEERRASTLLLVDDDLVLDGEAERGESLYRESLRRTLKRSRLERLSFLAGIRSEELAALVSGLCARGPLEGSRHVVVGRVVVEGEEAAGVTGYDLDESHLEAVEAALKRLVAEEPGAFEALDHAVWELVEASAKPSRRFLLLGELPASLSGHFRHAVSVALHTLVLGRALALGGGVLHNLAMGALLHDLGLWRMPAVLFDELAPSETAQAALRLHPELGAMRLAALKGAPELAVLVAYEHHLWWNGQGGYPLAAGRPGLDRPALGAQLVAVADVWDLTLHRPGPGSSAERRAAAAAELRSRAGRELNPDLVSIFLDGMGLVSA